MSSRRRTEAQTQLLDLLRRESTALSHDDISAKLPTDINRVTIYRILNRFVADGLAHRIVADDGRQYFASCADGCAHDTAAHGHLHFRCLVCDRVECLPEQVAFSLPEGYRVENYNVTLSGTCNSCSALAEAN
ncbi:hypothetical protein LEM8419_02435 [Neolewinella maritima]|uniref:Ferric uptake regulation protein n=1 Tax=Neolewinella maritima TaxID=1383882 RepID=A0ABN8F992_9BACT|nr:transcriptional repressor [Neolewinella maritima]CAH1001532.1 hypothetical protein LEM8419_02435 [Neolewinella maritima]